ncbi:MAG: hypothetical protein RLZZ171_1766 [Cyanobacteriota bacterium]|jgi:hypothetical protein
MGIKSQIKLLKTFFQQQLEPVDRQVLEVQGSTIRALTAQGYLEVKEVETGLLNGCYLLSQLELLAKLIADDVCEATSTHISFKGIEVEFSLLAGYDKFDYSSFEGVVNDLETQVINTSAFLKELKTILPFLDSKSNTSAFLLHNNYLYAHNGIAIIRHFSECKLSFQVTPYTLQIIIAFLEQQVFDRADAVTISVREMSIKIEGENSTILLPKHSNAAQTSINLESIFQEAKNYQEFDLDTNVVKRGIDALDLLENAEMRVLVIEETDRPQYSIKSACGKVKLKDLPKPGNLFNFAARSNLLKICISHLPTERTAHGLEETSSPVSSPSFDVKANILADKNTASMILFTDCQHDSQIIMSCILIN